MWPMGLLFEIHFTVHVLGIYSGWTRWCFQCYANRLGQTMLRNPVRFKIILADNYNYVISLRLHGGSDESARRH